MDPESTRQRLLICAEKLMAEKGIAATPVREITDASEANVAAVNYYFGSKTELLLELLKDRFLQLDAELLKRVEIVEQRTDNSAPGVRDLVGAYFDALSHLGFNKETGELGPFILLIQRASAEQEAVLERAQDYQAPGISRLKELLAARVPEDRRSYLEAPALIGLMFMSSVAAMPSMSRENRDDVLLEALREFLFAGVEAYIGRIRTR